ncbi:hypothetical protein LOCC1_G003727 [Lachnellula occidentalis]|uniref:Uncharacterized protein n=1 Tax=Lachnellula occidentalis TaxID=215460 RepID=A0A8H8UEQ1_9HELO|nr:hypothetical protein LOCC1_G003727 [Lachnellula occidentalis]
MQRTPPPKRRKVSPTASVPGDAPETPSRIPVSAAKALSERRPSFASPTKASIARHNPQLLNRPSSSGPGAQSTGKKLDDVFAKALGEVQKTVESQPGVTGGGTQSDATIQGSYVPATQGNTTPRARRLSVGGILSAKPRRMSRSPSKQPEQSAPVVPGYGDLQDNNDPFGNRGLRRSPVSSQVETELQDSVQNIHDPFKKKGLRRSPISSQPLGSFEEAIAEVSTAPTKPTLFHAARPITFNDVQKPEEQSMLSKIHAEKVVALEKAQEAKEPSPAPRQRTSQVTELARNNNFKRWMGSSDLDGVQQQQEGAAVSPGEPPLQPSSLANDVAQSRTPHQPELVETRLSVADVTESSGSSWLLPEDSAKEATQSRMPAPEELEILTAKSTRSNRRHLSEPKEAELPADEVNDSMNHYGSEPDEPEVDLPAKEVKQSSGSRWAEPEEIILSVKEINQARNSHRAESEEPELPPTPTQRGIPDPVVTTPPTGIHDTPSKRARKSKSLGQKLKSSPLKPRDPPPSEPSKEPEPAQEKKKPKEKEPATELEPEAKLEPEKPKRRKSARFLVPEDPYASKKEARDQLLKELQQLQADVALANQENERLRLHHESGKRRTTLAPNPEELIALLRRSTEQPSKTAPKPTSIFKSIGSFLPFSSRRRTQPVASSDLEKPLPSHLPIALDDPLPYLQAFSPLQYTSTIVLLPPEQTYQESSSDVPEQPILQKHSIHASHPTGLFASRLTMSVNSSTLSITDIDIPSLDASSEKELGAFVRDRAAGNGTLGKDINVICWAMGRWVELAIKRASFWCAIEVDFTTPEGREKALQRSTKSKKRQRLGSAIAGDGESEQEEGEELKKQKWTRRQLLPHMGRTSMEIVGEEVELRVEWSIGFDWTGEAENSISAGARVPKNWQKADDRKVLDRVPETFDRMVKEQGPSGAVRAIVGLLMPVS